MDDIVIAIGLAFGFLLLFMGATSSKKQPPPSKPSQPRNPTRKMRIDTIADQAHSLTEQEEVELIREIARDLKRKRLWRNYGKTDRR